MKRILVVDDAKNIKLMLTTCLELEGYAVSTAGTGEEALKLLETESFDLLFVDIRMPKISGTELLRTIRSMGLGVPVVIMTAFATVKNAVECMKLGSVAYLRKPFTADKVKALLAELEQKDEEDPSAEAYISGGRKLLEAGKLDEAYASLKTALSIEPERSDCYELIGRVYELKGDLEQAKRFYNAASQFKVTD